MTLKNLTYEEFLLKAYSEISLTRMNMWLRMPPERNPRGVLRRLDYAFGPIDDTVRADDINKSGYICLLDKLAKKTADPHAKELAKQVKYECKWIKKTVTYYLQGDFGQANRALEQLLNIYFSLENHSTYIVTANDRVWFRMRSTSKKETYEELGLYHIPFNKRHLIRTERYSVSGYPLLYLGRSLYDCWEELNRPNLQTTNYATYSILLPLRVLDLRIKDGLTDIKEIEKYMLALPMIIACSMQVVEKEGFFVPEYIMPQMLFKWLQQKYRNQMLENRDGDYIRGIMYTSSKRDAWVSVLKDESKERGQHISIDELTNCALLTYVDPNKTPTLYCEELPQYVCMSMPHPLNCKISARVSDYDELVDVERTALRNLASGKVGWHSLRVVIDAYNKVELVKCSRGKI